MKDFKKLPKMACGGKVKKYEDGGKVHLGKAPDTETIVRMNPKPNSDGNIYWTGSEPTASDKTKKFIREAIPNVYDAVQRIGNPNLKPLTYGNADTSKKKRGGSVKRKK
jgi:hypothetical protein